jgi:hypothetical protein
MKGLGLVMRNCVGFDSAQEQLTYHLRAAGLAAHILVMSLYVHRKKLCVLFKMLCGWSLQKGRNSSSHPTHHLLLPIKKTRVLIFGVFCLKFVKGEGGKNKRNSI